VCCKKRTDIAASATYSFCVKFLMVLIVLCCCIAGMLELWQAVLIDVGSLLVVVANGSSLLMNRSFRESDVPEEPDRLSKLDDVSYHSPMLDDSSNGAYRALTNSKEEDSAA
jgi:hypothetical protein